MDVRCARRLTRPGRGGPAAGSPMWCVLTSKRITLVDVALDAGVSRATASMVLRDAGHISVSTRKRVRASMQALGYVYHRGAASLRSSRTMTVGLVVPDLSNHFMAEMTIGLEAVLAEHGILTLTTNTFEDPARQHLLLRALFERQVDGIIVVPALGTEESFADYLAGAGIPAVISTRAIDDDRATYVGIDNVRGGELAATHLLRHGCRTFAYLGGMPGLRPRQDRLRGVRRALAPVGGARVVTHRSGPATGAWSRDLAERLFATAPLPDAVVCHNDSVAFGVYRALRDVVPEAVGTVRIVSFDDVDEAALWEPPMSSVAANGREVGLQAARALLRRIDDPTTQVEHVLLAPELVIRRSCGCPDDSLSD